MSYAFPPELHSLVQTELASGRYKDEDELLLEAVRSLRERESHAERFRRELQARIESVDRGEGIDFEDDEALREFFDDVKRRGRERYDARGQAE
jgi:putative addiction module CopG family antidote